MLAKVVELFVEPFGVAWQDLTMPTTRGALQKHYSVDKFDALFKDIPPRLGRAEYVNKVIQREIVLVHVPLYSVRVLFHEIDDHGSCKLSTIEPTGDRPRSRRRSRLIKRCHDYLRILYASTISR